jgi:hypothetical protein
MLQSWERGTLVGGTDGAEIILMVDDCVLSRGLFLVMCAGCASASIAAIAARRIRGSVLCSCFMDLVRLSLRFAATAAWSSYLGISLTRRARGRSTRT